MSEHGKLWHLGSMNDGLFIIDEPPRASTDDVWHERPDGPSTVLNVVSLGEPQAQAIVDAHNREAAALRSRLKEAEDLLREVYPGGGYFRVTGSLRSRVTAFLAGSTQGTPADSNGGGR